MRNEPALTVPANSLSRRRWQAGTLRSRRRAGAILNLGAVR